MALTTRLYKVLNGSGTLSVFRLGFSGRVSCPLRLCIAALVTSQNVVHTAAISEFELLAIRGLGMNRNAYLCCLLLASTLSWVSPGTAVELVTLTGLNWNDFVPKGKEVDAILGDYAVRSDQLVAIIAHPAERRNANMTVKNVSGCLIDLTQTDVSNDQLSAYYPGASEFAYTRVEYLGDGDASTRIPNGRVAANRIGVRCFSEVDSGEPTVTTTYWFEDGFQAIRVVTEIENRTDEPVTVRQRDSMRTDRSFEVGIVPERNLLWAHDQWWRQAYGIVSTTNDMFAYPPQIKQKRPLVRFGDEEITLAPKGKTRFERFVVVGANLIDVKGIAQMLNGGVTHSVAAVTHDSTGPVDRTLLTVKANGKVYGTARSHMDKSTTLRLPPGNYQVTAQAVGRPTVTREIETSLQNEVFFPLELPGFLTGRIRDADGRQIACKVEVRGVDGTSDPDFGPDSEVYGVKNLIYTPNGDFRRELAPGRYDLLISHGNEYDAVNRSVTVVRGEAASLDATLERSVDSAGWVSADFHSHSTPSGDNTSSQLGRVLNLLAEHIEFAPCTEHNRVSSYEPHLRTLDAVGRMATCTGMELTGSLLPVNHQNVFPLHHHPHTQDGGGPWVDSDPVKQIKRIADWDDGSEKLLQENHPNLMQIYGDRDTDGIPDGGFREMLGFMDVVEVHPPQDIFSRPKPGKPKDNLNDKIFHWMQLLNQGYRIPGVVNTDAHYTFHGSGWLRNYIKSSTDDPNAISTMEMVHASEHGHIVMTNGPFLEVSMESSQGKAIPGDDLQVNDGNARLHVRVQCPNWHSINRVQVFRNGVPDPEHNYSFASHRSMFKDGTVKFDETFDVELDTDAHFIVAVIGEGLELGPVFGPERGKAPPTAVANPIFVDTDGNGFQSNKNEMGYPLPEMEKTK